MTGLCRKGIEHGPDSDYYIVEMGVLNLLNGSGRYPFVTEPAALMFAHNHKHIADEMYDVDRDIRIRYPDGTVVLIDLTSHG